MRPAILILQEVDMTELRAIDLEQIGAALATATRPVSILWQDGETLAFVARGREHRSEFHVDPSDEVMLMLAGDMELHYLTPEGERKMAVVREGEVIHCPAGTPHSPHFSPDARVLVFERKRRPDEQDRFLWFCERCQAPLYEASRHVADYREDPVSRVYEEFYGDEAHLTCPRCGQTHPRPSA
jgi:3-hydroxyanthranilate 3,4-dioxygenase